MFGRAASYRFVDIPSDGRYNLALSQSQLDSAYLYEKWVQFFVLHRYCLAFLLSLSPGGVEEISSGIVVAVFRKSTLSIAFHRRLSGNLIRDSFIATTAMCGWWFHSFSNISFSLSRAINRHAHAHSHWHERTKSKFARGKLMDAAGNDEHFGRSE